MDMLLSLGSAAIATVLVIVFLKLTPYSGNKSKPKKNLPPGPWRLPIIGSLHHIFSGLPHRNMTELSRRHGPLMFLKMGEIPTVVVSSAEAAEVVMKTRDLQFATRPTNPTREIFGCSGKGIAFGPYGDHWRQMRKICIVELLSVKRMESIREEEVAHLLRAVAASSPGAVDLTGKLRALTNDIISRAVFSGRCTRQAEYLRELGRVAVLLGGFSLVDLFPSSRLVRWLGSGERRMRRSCERMQAIFNDIIEERKALRAAEGGCNADDEDFLDVLLRLQEENTLAFRLTSETIGVVIFEMFGAGSETSATTLQWIMSELLNNPQAMVKAQLEIREVLHKHKEPAVVCNSDFGELHYMKMVIKEVLRLHPPAPLLIPRKAREDCQIFGYYIAKGTNVSINTFAISRDPQYWEKPDEFKPERFQNSNVDYKGAHFEFTPFGAGRRQCPGILFATSTMEIALVNLLCHFDWGLPDGHSPGLLDMSEKFGITVGRRSDLHLKAIPRVPSKPM